MEASGQIYPSGLFNLGKLTLDALWIRGELASQMVQLWRKIFVI